MPEGKDVRREIAGQSRACTHSHLKALEVTEVWMI